MKQVKILKRPSAPPLPATPADRVTAEITQLLDVALSHERSRLEATYRARQDALLHAMSNVLNDNLERVVSTAAKRESDALVSSFAKLIASQAHPAFSSSHEHPQPSPESITKTRKAFVSAFEKSVLPAFEKAVSTMLGNLAAVVDAQVDEGLVSPAEGVVVAMEGAADSMRAAKSAVADMVVDSEAATEAADLAAVQEALNASDVRQALMLSVGKSVAVKAKAVSGVLDLNVGPEKAFEGEVPARGLLVGFAALLSMDLADRTEARLSWLYELVTLMDDAEEGEQEEGELTRKRLEGTVEKLIEFQKNGNLGVSDAKHVKLLIRVLQTHLKAM
eukprot:GFKZ01006322.1.p1 GENE.GFKZ01006322.1~~GFKZ01006322.1.p1  ORF type:complete len:334 (-),score=79.68 GFKZ01006322.1:1712-2713(-)